MANVPITIGGGGGNGSDDVTATRAHVLYPYTAITSDSDDEPAQGGIQSKSTATYNPSTAQQVIAGGQYLAGDQIIAPVTGTATPDKVLAGATFSSASGVNQTGSVPYYDYS